VTWSRRRVLQAGGALAGIWAAVLRVGTARSQDVAAGQDAAASPAPLPPKRIALINLHTDEHLDLEFFRDGAYVPDALAAIEVLLRDYRTGERHAIDPKLMDHLVLVARAVGVDPSFSVISGYRSPQTNAHLREQSAEVSQHSLHMEGRAIDVRMIGVDCADLAARAIDLRLGGVGYYRASNFVHLDTGAIRTWRG
jgi:uncharacterized protein YcbK (DUF882 family)